MCGDSEYFNITFFYGPKMYVYAALSAFILCGMVKVKLSLYGCGEANRASGC